MKIVLVSGGFDPLHEGHIYYFREAKKLGDKLIVAINSNEWLKRKKGKFFMSWDSRATIISELKCVDEVIHFNDSDNTANDAINQILKTKTEDDILIFANGGDRTNTSTPETFNWGHRKDLIFEFGVGGVEKKNSSSDILRKWKETE